MTVVLAEFCILSTSLLVASPVLPTGAYFVDPIRFLMLISLIGLQVLTFEGMNEIDE